ncbi:MAG: hypothetical protein AB7V58_00510 [Solirubrobacterales bacterium]
MRLPTPASPGAAARRSLLADLLAGIVIAVCAIVIAAGIGVIGFAALLSAVVLGPWYLAEAIIRLTRRSRRARTRRTRRGVARVRESANPEHGHRTRPGRLPE